MHTLSQAQRKRLESAAVKYLARKGEFPTREAIDAFVLNYLKDTTLGRPVSFNYKPNISENSTISASEFKKYFAILRDDIQNAFDTVYGFYDENDALFENANSLISFLQRRAKQFLNKASGLSASLGTGESIVDSFVDGSKINLSDTTARLDIKNGVVTSNFEMIPWGAPRDIELKLLDRNRILEIVSDEFSSLSNLLLDGTTGWNARFITETPEALSIELNLEIDLVPIEVSAIELAGEIHSPVDPLICELFYSVDGQDYRQLSARNLVVGGNIAFLESNVSMRYLRIKLTKLNPSNNLNGRYEFQFFLEQIRLLWFDRNRQGDLSILYTSEFETSYPFTSISLRTCETVGNNSSIRYFVSYKTGTDFSDWVGIEPQNRGGEPLLISEVLKSQSSDLTVGRVSNHQLSQDISNFALMSQGFFEVPEDIMSSDYRVWRNLSGRGELEYPNALSSTPKGWTFVDGYYQTYVNVIKETALDFGNSGLIIDGRFQTGLVNLSLGAHKIQIAPGNFETGVKQREIVGQLFQIYAADLQAAYLAHYVSKQEFFFNSSPTDYEKFTFADTYQNGRVVRLIFVKSSSQILDERFSFVCKRLTNDAATAVKLKAEFYSDGIAVPVLAGYNLTLG